VREGIEEHPGTYCEIARRDMQIGGIAKIDRIVYAVQEERLSDLAGSERRSSFQRSVISIGKVVRISVSWPPTDQACGGWEALPNGRAHTCAPSVEDGPNFIVSQGSFEESHFIN
jgi:hypothetical protein